jgi:hypothetical protein
VRQWSSVVPDKVRRWDPDGLDGRGGLAGCLGVATMKAEMHPKDQDQAMHVGRDLGAVPGVCATRGIWGHALDVLAERGKSMAGDGL